MSRPIKVLDFSKLMPGPFCTGVLADLGFEVLKVELPYWPDMVRFIKPVHQGQGSLFWILNRNKKSLALDFKKPEGQKIIRSLLKKADVLVEGFRPGLMAKLGLGPKSLLKKYPKLIYCSISGYGQTGPWSKVAGHDLNFVAACGLASLGQSPQPTLIPTQIADISASLYAAIAVLAALRERDRTGKGAHIDISITEAIFSCLPIALGEYYATGKTPQGGSHWWNGTHPFYGYYQTKDSRHLAVAALEKGYAIHLLKLLERKDLLPLLDGSEESWPVLKEELSGTFHQKTLQEWWALFKDQEVCVTPVWSFEEALNWEQVKARRFISEGKMKSPMMFSRPKTAPERRAPARMGQDNGSILKSLGYSKRQIRDLEEKKILSREEKQRFRGYRAWS